MKTYWAVPTDQYNTRGHRLWKLMEGEHFRSLDMECYDERQIWGSTTLEEIALEFLLEIEEVQNRDRTNADFGRPETSLER